MYLIEKTIEILTQRTRLRLIEISDLDSIHKLHSLPETDEYNTLGIPKSIEETKSVIEPWIAENKENDIRNYTFAIENNLNNDFIGLFGFKLGNKNINEEKFGIKYILIIGIKELQLKF